MRKEHTLIIGLLLGALFYHLYVSSKQRQGA